MSWTDGVRQTVARADDERLAVGGFEDREHPVSVARDAADDHLRQRRRREPASAPAGRERRQHARRLEHARERVSSSTVVVLERLVGRGQLGQKVERHDHDRAGDVGSSASATHDGL